MYLLINSLKEDIKKQDLKIIDVELQMEMLGSGKKAVPP